MRVRVRVRVVVAPGHRARGEARPRSTVAPVDILVALPRAPAQHAAAMRRVAWRRVAHLACGAVPPGRARAAGRPRAGRAALRLALPMARAVAWAAAERIDTGHHNRHRAPRTTGLTSAMRVPGQEGGCLGRRAWAHWGHWAPRSGARGSLGSGSGLQLRRRPLEQMREEAQQRARARLVVGRPLGHLLRSRPWLGRPSLLLRQ